MSTKPRFKKFNIFLFLIIIGVIYYAFNKQKVHQQLEKLGFEVKKDTTTVVLPDSSLVTQKIDSTQIVAQDSSQNQSLVDTSKQNQVQWNILTQYGDFLYIEEQNKIQIKVNGRESKDITPIINGKGVKLDTINLQTGQYTLAPTQKGTIEVWLSAINEEGKRDILASKTFTIIQRQKTSVKGTAEEPTRYLWDISTETPDTLYAYRPNKITIEIAEVDPATIQPVITYAPRNTIKPIQQDKGEFLVTITKGKVVNVTVQLAPKNGTIEILGSRQYMVLYPDGMTPDEPNKDGDTTIIANSSTSQLPTSTVKLNSLWKPVLYKKIANQIVINTDKLQTDSIVVKVDHGKVINKDKQFYIRPKKEGDLTAQLWYKGEKISEQVYQVKDLPDPTISIAGQKSGTIRSSLFKEAKNITIAFEDLPVKAKIRSFKLRKYTAEKKVEHAFNQGATFQKNSQQLISQAERGDLYYITNIVVQVEGVSIRLKKGVAFEIQ